MARAVSDHADGNFLSAVAMYEKARRSIENDENVRTQRAWQALVEQIQQVEELARRQVRLSSGFMSHYHGS
jgi:hypothetical protein